MSGQSGHPGRPRPSPSSQCPKHERDLARVFGPIEDLATELWLITHQDLRATARIRAFMDHVGGVLAQQGAMFAGRRR
jgi:hypothetical protein